MAVCVWRCLRNVQQTIRPELPPLPEELRNHICSYLPEIVDLVRLSMVSKEWRGTARGHETKDRRPIFTDQAGVEEVWPHLPFGKVYGGHGGAVWCVRADGGCLYTGCRDGRARKIEVDTGEVEQIVPCGGGKRARRDAESCRGSTRPGGGGAGAEGEC